MKLGRGQARTRQRIRQAPRVTKPACPSESSAFVTIAAVAGRLGQPEERELICTNITFQSLPFHVGSGNSNPYRLEQTDEFQSLPLPVVSGNFDGFFVVLILGFQSLPLPLPVGSGNAGHARQGVRLQVSIVATVAGWLGQCRWPDRGCSG